VPAEAAVAVDDLRLALEDRLQQAWDVLGVVLEVGVEDDHVVAVGGVDRGADRRALAPVALVADHPQAVVVPRVQDRGGAVEAAVIDDDELDLAGVLHRECLLERLG
jgi:hypothetical protein